MKVFAFIVMIASLCFSNIVFAQDFGQPTFSVTKQSRSNECLTGAGVILEEGYVKAMKDELIYIVIYLQKYDGTWANKYFKRKGKGTIQLNISGCEFTGNFYAFASYSSSGGRGIPSAQEVQKKHSERGTAPLFRVTKRKKFEEDCENGAGVAFKTGEIFTPKGETVNLTVFLEKKDGSWRKKHFNHRGSGFIELDISNCDLTGKYKSRVVFDK